MSSYPSIRPVTRTFPASSTILDQSNLPFAVTLTPLHPPVIVLEQDDNEDPPRQPPSLHGIPKCLRCGAPHADRATHVRYNNNNNNTNHNANNNLLWLACYLCGKASSLAPHEQAVARAAVEGLPPSLDDDNDNDNDRQYEQRTTSSSTSSTHSTTHKFSLPLRLASAQQQQQQQSPAYEVPALECPPLWFVVLDGSCTEPNYWNVVSDTLQYCLITAPPHVHVSILIAGSSSTSSSSNTDHQDTDTTTTASLGILDLQSAVPHLKHYYRPGMAESDLYHAVAQSLVPMDNTNRPHMITSIRSLLDQHLYCNNNHNNNSRGGCPVAWTTQIILATLQTCAAPAGHRRVWSSSSQSPHRLPYAGGKLWFLLAQRPVEISSRGTTTTTTTMPSTGGWGGLMSRTVGERFGSSSSSTTDDAKDNPDPLLGTTPSPHSSTQRRRNNNKNNAHRSPNDTELTPSHLQQHYHPDPGIVEEYAELGRQCADAAMGVDLFLLVDSSSRNGSVTDFGMALFAGLALKSGAHGPLLFDFGVTDPTTDTDTTRDTTTPQRNKNPPPNNHHHHPNAKQQQQQYEYPPDTPLTLLQREALSRTPWQEGLVFGAELRLRLSPGFAVDTDNVDNDNNKNADAKAPHLAGVYHEAGLVGPAAAVGDVSASASSPPALWRMGVADPFTTVTIDLVVDDSGGGNDSLRTVVVEDQVVTLQPVLQTCLAYTTIVQRRDDNNNNNNNNASTYMTVRQMRIASRPVPLAHSVEALYATLDTESLAVVLFHKLALAAFQDGLRGAAELANQWLQHFLVSVYRSAEDQWQQQRQREAQGIETTATDTTTELNAVARYFYPSERLLDLEGDLSVQDVVLAQGHERLRPIPLMVYLLLQSDPLRFRSRSYRPSHDLRMAALAQMTSMPPGTLTRCLAPRLQLWESDTSSRSSSSKNKTKNHVNHITAPALQEPILDVLDLRSEAVQSAVLEYSRSGSSHEPQSLILFLDTPEHIVLMDARYVNTDDHDGDTTGRESSRNRPPPLVMGEGLRQAVQDAADSYRTRPRVVYELDQSATAGEATFLRLLDCLLEDTPNVATGCENFAQYQQRMAQRVQQDIDY